MADVNDTCGFAGCGRPLYGRGLCKTHCEHTRNGGEARPIRPMTAPPRVRFWEKVLKTGGCWNWTGSIERGERYGRFWDGTRVTYSHRFAYRDAVGPIPAGCVIDHICHNRVCVNPAHLRAVTQKQNAENRRGAQPNNLSSGIRGVYPEGRKWEARVHHNGKGIRVGAFDTIEEAEAAVIEARKSIFTHSQ